MSSTISPVQSAATALGNAVTAADAATNTALADLARRVTALEQTTRPVPSPDGAQAITPQTVLITADFAQWRLAGASGGYTVEWMPLGATAWAAAGSTANATRLETWKGLLYHTSPNASSLSTPGWWRASVTGTTVGWVEVPGDPSLTEPPPPPPGTGFTIGPSVPMPTDGAVNVNLTAPTGFVTGPELWGVSQSTSGGSWANSFGNAAWVSAMAALDIRSWRLQGEGALAACFGGPNVTTNPNWAPIEPLVANINKAFPNARRMWTLVDPNMVPGYQTVSPAAFASQATQLLNYLNSRGVPMHYIEPYNELDGHVSTEQCQAVDAAMGPAIAALGRGYKFGTSPTTMPIHADLINAAITGYPATDYISGHWYAGQRDRGEAGVIGNDLFLATDPWWVNSVLPGETVKSKKYPFALSEYAMSWGGGGSIGPESTNMAASCMYAGMVAFGAARNIFWATRVWDGAQGVYGWTGNASTMAPHCFMLAQCGKAMPGNIVAANNSLGLVVLATTAGILVVNLSTTAARSGKLSVGGLANPSLHRWQQAATDANGGFTNRAGVTTAIAAAELASQSFPALSVTVFTP